MWGFFNAVHLSLFFIPVRVAEPEQCCLCNNANQDTSQVIIILFYWKLQQKIKCLTLQLRALWKKQGLLFWITPCLRWLNTVLLAWWIRWTNMAAKKATIHRQNLRKKFWDIWQNFFIHCVKHNENFKMEVEQTNFGNHCTIILLII